MKTEADSEFVDSKNLTRKHIAERQRRARINSYLEEIQDLTHAGSTEGQKVKLEKAEVLETALEYIQNNQPFEQNNNNIAPNPELIDIQAYEEGYRSCMSTILQGFEDAGLLENVIPDLKSHLESSLENTLSATPADTAELPMAFSPSLAKLEQYLQKFENGNISGENVITANNKRCDSVKSEGNVSKPEPISVHNVTSVQNNGMFDIENMDFLTGYGGVNEWVNMQREYVMYQQNVYHHQQQQQRQQQQQSFQNLQQNHGQLQKPLDFTSSNGSKNNVLPLDFTSTTGSKNNVNVTETQKSEESTINSENKTQNSKVIVWRPW